MGIKARTNLPKLFQPICTLTREMLRHLVNVNEVIISCRNVCRVLIAVEKELKN